MLKTFVLLAGFVCFVVSQGDSTPPFTGYVWSTAPQTPQFTGYVWTTPSAAPTAAPTVEVTQTSTSSGTGSCEQCLKNACDNLKPRIGTMILKLVCTWIVKNDQTERVCQKWSESRPDRDNFNNQVSSLISLNGRSLNLGQDAWKSSVDNFKQCFN